ncbi:MAG TPA: hypothetical protein ENO05_01060, partial [Bacteroides sp.]|nr:hypothetical protein [Bacteroides sp.]
MRLRPSFTFRIFLPYLVIGSFFLLIFLAELERGHPPVIWLSAGGLLVTMLMAALHNRWLTLPFKRVRDLVAQLARGSMPGFSASETTGEVGALEKNLEKHVSRMREIASFANS